jgi:hypothetical protein
VFFMLGRIISAMAVSLALSACAGRDPQPIASVQPQDVYADCTMIRAEIEANNQKTQQLANEQGWKVAQNVGAGVVGLVIWPVWFGMDFKDAAGKDAAALQAPAVSYNPRGAALRTGLSASSAASLVTAYASLSPQSDSKQTADRR